jgi:hypothetical protein
MNASEAITKIAELLGMSFKRESFMVTKLEDGSTEITNNKETLFDVGDELFLVEDSILKPAPAGTHTTREGVILTVGEDSVISKIEKVEDEEQERVEDAETEIEVDGEAFDKAKLTDGTVIFTEDEGDFAVGQKLFAETESGETVQAPEGEHTTESGVVITVDGEGVITGVKYPDEAGEGSLEGEMKKMKESMSQILSVVSDLNKELSSFKKDYAEFKKQPNFREPVVKKTFAKENILDAKMDFLRSTILNKN